MIPIKRLFLVIGFEGATLEKTVRAVERTYVSGSHRFITRPYPQDAEKRGAYLKAIVAEANTFIFGDGGETNFCRRLDQPCALDSSRGKLREKACQSAKSRTLACTRARPQMLIAICADQLFNQAFERIGRAALFLRLPGPVLLSEDELTTALAAFEPAAAHVLETIARRRKNLYAPLIPFKNFQELVGKPIAAEAQAAPIEFSQTMERWHHALYASNFQNPRRPVRGAYMLDDQIAFQQDHLHDTTQSIGPESRKDGFHLLNAYYTYGVRVDPGFHFDVMARSGKRIGYIFSDVVTNTPSGADDEHINLTPCDRWWK